MRILFIVSRLAHVRHFDRAIRVLADRGHDVILVSQDDDVELHGVLTKQSRITAVAGPRNRTDDWGAVATTLRRVRDFNRYLHPRYAHATLLRRRAFEKMIHAIGPAREIPPGWSELLRGVNKKEQRRLDAMLIKLEQAVPVDAGIHAFVAAQHPDVMVLSPMVGIGFSQADFVKSARALGIPTAMLAFSWDNLSNKGLIHEMPDRLIVWNEIQAHEAFKLHKYPREQVVVTGAPRFDAFFEMQPQTTREEFCGMVGLDPGRPILTYLCSSKFVAAREQAFVPKWIQELRRSDDPLLASASIIVRPHPAGMKGWHGEPRHVVRWPRVKAKASVSRPFDDPQAVVMNSPMQNADQVLYDTVYHSAAVVGLNTSAEIEAAIVGRPVYTILDSAAEGQEGTLHFHYLLQAHGGHVNLADSFAQHRAQLSDALAGRYDHGPIAAFVQGFVRPRGLSVPASPLVADAIEEAARLRLEPAAADRTSDQPAVSR